MKTEKLAMFQNQCQCVNFNKITPFRLENENIDGFIQGGQL